MQIELFPNYIHSY